jgi:hypothetical protein
MRFIVDAWLSLALNFRAPKPKYSIVQVGPM